MTLYTQQATTTEWAVRLADGSVRPMPSREYAERWAFMETKTGQPLRPNAAVVSRLVTVTEWVEQ